MAVLNSAILATGAVAFALPAGTLLAVLITRFNLPGRRMAAACLASLLLLPLYVTLSGWDASLGKLGWYSLTSGTMAQPLLAGMRGAIIVHGMAAIPWVATIVGLGLLSVRRSEEEAALLVLPPVGVLAKVTLPQVAPFFVAAALWTVVMTTSDMTVTNIYLIDPGQQTYTERFYMAMALSADASQATVAALPGVLGLIILVSAAMWLTTRLITRSTEIATRGPAVFEPGGWKPFLTAMLWLVVLVLLAVPIASLLAKAGFIVLSDGPDRVPAWSASALVNQLISAPARFSRETAGTLVVALGAATVALLAAMPLAWFARRGGFKSLPAAIAVAFGLAIPGPLVGVILIQIFNHDISPAILFAGGTAKSWLLVLYDDTPLAPMLAQGVRALPLAILLVWHTFATLDDDVLSAAALDGLNPREVFRRIALRQRWREVAATWLVSFAIAAGDLAWAHLVTPPGLDLLSRRIFGLVHSGVEEQVAAICLLTMAAYALLCFLVLKLLSPATTSAS